MAIQRRLAYIRLCGETSLSYYLVAAIVWLSCYKLGVAAIDAAWGKPFSAFAVFVGIWTVESLRLRRYRHRQGEGGSRLT